MTVTINPPGMQDWPALMALLHAAFAPMHGRIDPPSSLARMDVTALRDKARHEDLFLATERTRPVACLFATPRDGDYHLTKLAVAPDRQGRGLARRLIAAASIEARRRALPALVLTTRVELRENHRAFRAMGFRLVGASRHPGFTRVTSLTFRRDV